MELKGQLKKLTVTILLAILAISAISTTATLFPAKADPEDVQVLSYSWYVYPPSSYTTGDVIVVGEIQNTGNSTLITVYLQGTVYDTDGQARASKQVRVYGEDILPHHKAPFYFDFYDMETSDGNMTWINYVDHVEFSVVYAQDTTDQPFADLQIFGASGHVDANLNNVYAVYGVVQNVGTESSPNMVWVVTTFYDSTGTVIAVNNTASPFTTSGLGPGDTMAFIAQPQDYTQITKEIASFAVLVQSREYTASTPTPSTSATSSPSPTPSPSSSVTTQPTETAPPSTTSESSDLIYIVIVAVVVVVVVVGLLVVSRRKK
jgi:cobalamin biosynthesis Mg chelatase CobN